MPKTNNATASLADLEVETSQESFTFDLGSKVIEFPAPTGMGWDEAEEFMNTLSGENPNFRDIFKTWLTDEDYEALSNANLSLGQTVALVKLATDHYAAIFGTAPNS